MLTFRFDGADGSMEQKETLTAGMVKKKVKLVFSSDWDNMTKTVVFTAGSVTRSVVDVSDIAVIPAEVLATPLKELYVGVYGVDKDGRVTPTIRVKGPEIKPGTNPSYDKGTDPDLAVWAQILQEIHAIKDRGIDGTDGGYYIPEVTQPDSNNLMISFVPNKATMPTVEPVTITLPGSDTCQNQNTGLSSGAITMLVTILRNAVYPEDRDQSVNITALESLLREGSGSDDSGTPDDGSTTVTMYSITNALSKVTTSNDADELPAGASYSATLTADNGYTLSGAEVTVTMAGVDITSSVYADGVITIPSVAGNIVITATAIETQVGRYGQQMAKSCQSAISFTVDASATWNRVVLDMNIMVKGTNGGNHLLFSNGGAWGGFNSAQNWMWNNVIDNSYADKTVAEIIGKRSTVEITLPAERTGEISLGGWDGVFQPEMIWYNAKVYNTDGMLLLDAYPIATLGEWYDAVNDAFYTVSTTEGLTVVEVE